MKTNEPKYTLVVADLQVGDTSPVQGMSPALESQLGRIPSSVLRIGPRMFLFDTLKDYGSLHNLAQDLASIGRLAAILPIEEELHIVCDDQTVASILARFPNLKVFRLPWTR
jgi:hypothetical protein